MMLKTKCTKIPVGRFNRGENWVGRVKGWYSKLKEVRRAELD